MRHALLLLLLLAAPLLRAQGLVVDVLVFRHAGQPAPGVGSQQRELLPCNTVALRSGGGAEALFTPGEPGCRMQDNAPVLAFGLGSTEPVLAGTHGGKLRAAGYTLLLGQAWQQAVPNGAPVLLRDNTQQLEGTVSVAGEERAPEVTLALSLRLPGDGAAEYVALRETRRLKPGEVHYFDHPLLGALVQVSAEGTAAAR